MADSPEPPGDVRMPLFRDASIGFALLSDSGMFRQANSKLCESLGFLEDELCGMNIADLLHPEDCAAEMNQRQQVANGTLGSYNLTLRARRKNGSFTRLRISSSIAPGVAGIMLIIEDLPSGTSERTADFLQSEARFRRVFDSNMLGVFFGDIHGQVTQANEAFLQMVGYTHEDVEAGRLSWLATTPDEYLPLLEKVRQELRETGKSGPYERQYIHRDGHRVHAMVGVTLLENSREKAACFVLDITRRRQAEEALLESEQRFRAMADDAPFMLAVSGNGQDSLYFNKPWLEYTGQSLEEVIRFGWLRSLHPEDRDFAMQTYRAALLQHRPFELEYRLRRHDGVYRWMFSRISPRFTASGGFKGYIGTSIDIHERKQVEETLRNSFAREQLIRRHLEMMNASLDINWILQSTVQEIRKFLEVDRCTIALYTREEGPRINLLAQTCGSPDIAPISAEDIDLIARAAQHLSPEALTEGRERITAVADMESYLDTMAQQIEELQIPLEAGTLHAMAEKYRIRSLLRVSISYRGIPYGSLSLHQCNRRREWQQDEIELLNILAHHLGSALYQAELYQKEQGARKHLELYTQKLETSNRELEEFAFVASHDLQAPLRKIIMFSSFLKEIEGEIPPEGQDFISRITACSQKMQDLITDLLNLSRVHRRQEPFREISLNQVLGHVHTNLQASIDETQGTLVLEDLPVIEGDPNQLQQLFQNLVENALKFHRKDAPPVVRVRAEQDGKAYRIIVEDNGIGFDEQYQQRIFKIFERLSPTQYDGTGIGLAICKKIVERHNGQIQAFSTPGEGSCFVVTLPARQA
ncbi:MAG TPA: PAS domain S-box protein [Coleofasciculaceae cyanobacterium]